MLNVLIVIIVVGVLWSVWGFFGSRVEQADYTVTKKMPGYEVRTYPAHLVAQTTVEGSYDQALNEGFRIVAGYIFGGNTKKEKIAMTAPVAIQSAEKDVSQKIAMTAPVLASIEGTSHVISFGMPRGYTLETLPVPQDKRVKIVMVPEKMYAALRFSGWRSNARTQRMQEKLLAFLKHNSVTAVGAPVYAGYNAPWTPPWMTRNEVLVEIQ